MQENSSMSTLLFVGGLTVGIVLTTTATMLYEHVLHDPSRKKDEDASWDAQRQEWKQKRQEERTGRIRAEQKLRAALLLQRQQQEQPSTSSQDMAADGSSPTGNSSNTNVMRLQPIGTIVSPYPKRMGTPRQGALVPSSRGYIQFTTSTSPELWDGIHEYSHCWIVFGFHQNTSLSTSQKTKIRPPRGGGIKVGQLATRSPHRPNPLGLSLVTLDHTTVTSSKKSNHRRRLHITALDLVDGTPVYDIKPYVQWDIPAGIVDTNHILKLPSWVESKADVLPTVTFTKQAESSLQDSIRRNLLAPLYPKQDDTALEAAKHTLMEILMQDPRSSHRGLAKNQRGSTNAATSTDSQTQEDDSYRLLFCSVEIEFVVSTQGANIVAIHPQPVEATA